MRDLATPGRGRFDYALLRLAPRRLVDASSRAGPRGRGSCYEYPTMPLLSAGRRTPASVNLIRAEEAERVPATGAVASVQEAEVSLPRELLDELWRPENLERLARAYWRYLTRVTLGLVRVVYGPDYRAVVLLHRRLSLLRFHVPEYETGAGFGQVSWRIDRGLLVAKSGRGGEGFLRIRVTREHPAAPGREAEEAAGIGVVHVELAVRNFYPLLRGGGRFARLGAWFYAQTQLRIHVLVCNGFLRSLARIDLPPSRVGALRGEIEAAGDRGAV